MELTFPAVLVFLLLAISEGDPLNLLFWRKDLLPCPDKEAFPEVIHLYFVISLNVFVCVNHMRHSVVGVAALL